jgi:hypothetical protein
VDSLGDEIRRALDTLPSDAEFAAAQSALESARARLASVLEGSRDESTVARFDDALAIVASARTRIEAARGHFAAYPPVASPPVAAGTPPATGTPAAAEAPPAVAALRERLAAVAVDLCTDGWQHAVAAQAADAVDATDWTRCVGDVAACRDLAATANWLSTQRKQFAEARGEAAGWITEHVTAQPFAATVAKQLAMRVKVPGEDAVVATVQVLRVMGVYVCARRGRLAHCACLRAFAVDDLPDILAGGLHQD